MDTGCTTGERWVKEASQKRPWSSEGGGSGSLHGRTQGKEVRESPGREVGSIGPEVLHVRTWAQGQQVTR